VCIPVWYGVRVATIVLVAVTGSAAADAPVRSFTWKTGVEFQRQLESEVVLLWQDIPLRTALNSLSQRERIAVLLDRRIDPGQTLQLSLDSMTLADCLGRISGHVEAEVCHVGPVIYIAPGHVAGKLPILVSVRTDQARRLDGPSRRKWLGTWPWRWDNLVTPRQLVEQLSKKAKVRVEGIERVPHDLWPAADLPPLSVVQQLSLVTAGFGLTFEIAPDGQSAQVVPIPEEVSIERRYRIGGQAVAASLSRQFPQSEVRVDGNQLVVVGSWEVHQHADRLVKGKPPRQRPRTTSSRQLHTLRVPNLPVGTVLNALAQRLDLELKVDPRWSQKLEQRIRVEVESVTRDELLRSVLEPAGLTFQIDGRTLEIVGKDVSPNAKK